MIESLDRVSRTRVLWRTTYSQHPQSPVNSSAWTVHFHEPGTNQINGKTTKGIVAFENHGGVMQQDRARHQRNRKVSDLSSASPSRDRDRLVPINQRLSL
ncbi:hypothetical protein NPIL_556271 [Nephila pilipes]|uniref:Uncharacterized protein n=1 Tax=Nephila pilipes TaxID=299642 RepID=A0A8X6N047_NEPPI|nr:hypothetical protein NPIL_556251 [Nephila pilipes]GFS87082.1 hypothetical protein NPIL_556271 [Nephila pilipes]